MVEDRIHTLANTHTHIHALTRKYTHAYDVAREMYIYTQASLLEYSMGWIHTHIHSHNYTHDTRTCTNT